MKNIQIAKSENLQQHFTNDEITIIKQQIMPGATNNDLNLFSMVCCRTGLDPFSRQIYAVSRWDNMSQMNKWSYQTSVDGFRLIAERSGAYLGQTEALWCGSDGVWVDVWLKNEPPMASKVGVYKKGHKEPIYAVARFSSYAQTKKGGELTAMWRKMPDVMIAKCAECLALRKAFPNELSGLYTGEEMAQSENSEQYKHFKPESDLTIDSANISSGLRDELRGLLLDLNKYKPEYEDYILKLSSDQLVKKIEELKKKTIGEKK